MTFRLPDLFHWAPSDRRIKITQEGLKTYSKPTVISGRLRSPYICLGFTPSGAWTLSGDFMRDRESQDPIEDWDLWQVSVPGMAHIEIRPEYGPKLQEVKVFTSIPSDHLWYVGSREPPYFQ